MTTAKIEILKLAKEAAKVARDANPTSETREAYRAAWQAFNDAIPRQKGRGSFASRAGQRQYKERRAMYRG